MSSSLSRSQIDCIQSILKKYLPTPGTLVHAFGSRIDGGFRPNSDLDLWVDSKTPIPLSTIAKMREDFEESNLPFRIDLIFTERLTPEMLAHLKNCKKEKISF